MGVHKSMAPWTQTSLPVTVSRSPCKFNSKYYDIFSRCHQYFYRTSSRRRKHIINLYNGGSNLFENFIKSKFVVNTTLPNICSYIYDQIQMPYVYGIDALRVYVPINPYHAEVSSTYINIYLIFCHLSTMTGWNLSPWKTKTHSSCIVNAMAADDLAT